jgi:hypothetical protein
VGQSYRDLIAWQKAMHFVMDVYRTSKGFPRDELYALASQLRRAAVRVPTNMAEGQGRFRGQRIPLFPGTSPRIAGRGGNPADDGTEPDLFFSRTREGSHGQSGRVGEDTKRSDRRHSASGLAESKEPGSGNWYYRPRTCIPFCSAFFSVSRQRRPMCLAAPLSSRKTGTVLT